LCRSCFLRAQRPGPQSCETPRRQGGTRGRDGDWPRQQIRGGFREVPHSAADGGGAERHGAIATNLFTRACPSSTPAPIADATVQEDLRRANERQERAARNLVRSFAFGAPGVGGGHRHARGGWPFAREFLLSRARSRGPNFSIRVLRERRGLSLAEATPHPAGCRPGRRRRHACSLLFARRTPGLGVEEKKVKKAHKPEQATTVEGVCELVRLFLFVRCLRTRVSHVRNSPSGSSLLRLNDRPVPPEKVIDFPGYLLLCHVRAVVPLELHGKPRSAVALAA
jgi:hypothetical protein